MKILFVTPPPYLPNRLHRNRSFDLIRILAIKNEVHLLSVTTYKEEPKEFREIKKVCKSVSIIYLNPLKALLSCVFFPFLPFEVAFCKSNLAKKAIVNIVRTKNIDLIYAKRLRSAIFIPELNIPIILDTTDAMSMFYNRLYNRSNFPKKIIYKLEEIKYKAFEKKIMKRINNWIVCSTIDQKYLQKFGRDVNVHLVPNPVDADYFSPSRSPSATSKVERTKELACLTGVGRQRPRLLRGGYVNSLLFRGLMDKQVNIDSCLFFIKEIMPLVKKKIKDVRLFIVGPKPHRSIQKLHDGKSIFVTGFVEDIRRYMAETAISICPVRIGSGTRFKILQAWSMGKPVVSTSIGVEGLVFKKDYNIAIANTQKEFAEKIIRLLQDKKYYSTLQKNGLKSVVAEHSFNAVKEKLEEVFSNVYQRIGRLLDPETSSG